MEEQGGGHGPPQGPQAFGVLVALLTQDPARIREYWPRPLMQSPSGVYAGGRPLHSTSARDCRAASSYKRPKLELSKEQ